MFGFHTIDRAFNFEIVCKNCIDYSIVGIPYTKDSLYSIGILEIFVSFSIIILINVMLFCSTYIRKPRLEKL